MPVRALIALAALAFLGTLLVRLPAGMLTPWLPAAVRCNEASGTLWSGACAELATSAGTVQGLRWSLHPLALLRLRVVADVSSDDPGISARGTVDFGPDGSLELRGFSANVPLPDKFGALPRNLAGNLQLMDVQALLPHALQRTAHFAALSGRAELRHVQFELPRELASMVGTSTPELTLGDYAAQFTPQPAGSPILGQLRDLNGPMSLAGQLRVQANGAYQVAGTVAARAGAPMLLEQLLQLLGPPDAAGRHSFALSGTY